MATFNAGSIEATLDLDVDPFQRGIRWAREEGRRFAQERYAAKLDVDTSAARGHMAAIRAELTRVATGSYTIRLDLAGSAGVLAQLMALEAALTRMDAHRANPRIDVDTAGAMAQIAALQAQLASLGGVNANVNTTSLAGGLGGATGAMRGLIAAGLALAPALIPGLVAATAAAGGLTSALMAAGGGIGVLAAGVIGNVVQVTGAQKTLEQSTAAVEAAGQAAAAAQLGAAGAARQVQSAEQALADTRRAAAQSVASAENQLAAAQRSVGQAQEALNQARQEAADRLADYRDQLRGAALDEDAAELAVRRARQTLQDVLEDPNSTKLDRDEAQHALQEALFQLDEVRESRDELQNDVAEQRKKGIAGSDEVKAARDRLRAANEQLRVAEQNLANARRQGEQQIAAAQQALADAQRNAGTAAATSAAAQRDLAAAQAEQATAMATLSTPAAIAYTEALDAAKDAWREFLELTRDSSLGVATQALELFARWMPELAPAANAAAEGVGRLLDRLDGWLEDGGMDAIVGFLVEYAPGMIESLGIILGNLARWFGGVADAFAPFAQDMLDGLERITDGWADWAEDLDQNDGFQRFIDYAREYGPKFLDFLGSVGDAFFTIGQALAPGGEVVLTALTTAFRYIGDMDPQTLAALMALFGVVLAIAGGPVATIAGLTLLFYGLSGAMGDMRKTAPGVADALEAIGDQFGVFWGWLEEIGASFAGGFRRKWDDMQPKFTKLADTLRDDLAPAAERFWDEFGPAIKWLAGKGGEQAAFALGDIADGMTAVAEELTIWMDAAVDFKQRWEAWRIAIVGTWNALWDSIQRRMRDSWNNIADALWRGKDSLRGRAVDGFTDMVSGIGRQLDRLRNLAMTPVKFVVDTIYNRGIVPMVNAIPGVGNINTVDTSGWGSHARGGVLPGYTPGRDVHHFYSPTAGDLHLSGGEAIMRPEWVRQVGGPAAVERMNAAARSGTEQHGRHYFMGGVLPLDGGAVTGVHAPPGSYYGAEYAADLNSANDLANPPSAVRAWKAGTVAQVAYAPGSYGNYVVVNHGSGSSLYAHLSSVATRGGAQVAGGQILGRVGSTGNSTGAHLHFEVDDAASLVGSGYAGVGASGSVTGSIKQGVLSQFSSALAAARSFAGDIPGWLSRVGGMGGDWGGMMRDAAGSLGRSAAQYVNDKIPNRFLPDNPVPLGIFDNGGWLPPGGMALNLGDTPEPVLTGAQWRTLAGVSLSGAAGGGLSRDDVDRIVAAIEENRSVHVDARDTVTASAVVEKLDAALRRGRF